MKSATTLSGRVAASAFFQAGRSIRQQLHQSLCPASALARPEKANGAILSDTAYLEKFVVTHRHSGHSCFEVCVTPDLLLIVNRAPASGHEFSAGCRWCSRSAASRT